MRWVIKTGSAILSKPQGGLNRAAVRRIATQIIRLHRAGHEVILVSSGAVAAGVGRLGWSGRPADLRLKQSAAAVGQLALLEAYEAVFSKEKIIPAQILLTREDLLDRKRYLNIRTTLMTLLSLKTIPILNENDSVSTDEIQFGDNDTLSAIVAAKVEADRLVLLSDVRGVFEPGFEKKRHPAVLAEIDVITRDLERSVSAASGSRMSVGGMVAKIGAAKMATAAGIETWIASGYDRRILEKIESGSPGSGTRFRPRTSRLPSRDAWIAFGRRTKGALLIDDGAVRALVEKKTSLLASGIRAVRGTFSIGDAVQIRGRSGAEVGRGLVNFSSAELGQIRGRHSRDIPGILGRSAAAAVVHRDNLVLL